MGEGGRSLHIQVREARVLLGARLPTSGWVYVEGLADLKAIASGLLLPEIGRCASKLTK